ncbi:hypothetical protein Q7P37_001028 [Cladosporium fusiforme]
MPRQPIHALPPYLPPLFSHCQSERHVHFFTQTLAAIFYCACPPPPPPPLSLTPLRFAASHDTPISHQSTPATAYLVLDGLQIAIALLAVVIAIAKYRLLSRLKPNMALDRDQSIDIEAATGSTQQQSTEDAQSSDVVTMAPHLIDSPRFHASHSNYELLLVSPLPRTYLPLSTTSLSLLSLALSSFWNLPYASPSLLAPSCLCGYVALPPPPETIGSFCYLQYSGVAPLPRLSSITCYKSCLCLLVSTLSAIIITYLYYHPSNNQSFGSLIFRSSILHHTQILQCISPPPALTFAIIGFTSALPAAIISKPAQHSTNLTTSAVAPPSPVTASCTAVIPVTHTTSTTSSTSLHLHLNYIHLHLLHHSPPPPPLRTLVDAEAHALPALPSLPTAPPACGSKTPCPKPEDGASESPCPKPVRTKDPKLPPSDPKNPSHKAMRYLPIRRVDRCRPPRRDQWQNIQGWSQDRRHNAPHLQLPTRAPPPPRARLAAFTSIPPLPSPAPASSTFSSLSPLLRIAPIAGLPATPPEINTSVAWLHTLTESG